MQKTLTRVVAASELPAVEKELNELLADDKWRLLRLDITPRPELPITPLLFIAVLEDQDTAHRLTLKKMKEAYDTMLPTDGVRREEPTPFRSKGG